MRKIRIALAQMNATVGDIPGNTAKIRSFLKEARAKRADIIVFPELAVTGYPPEDLLFKKDFLKEAKRCVLKLAPHTRGITAILGFPNSDRGGRVYNAAAILSKGRVAGCYHKMNLPNYGVFDEKRYFTPGKNPLVFDLASSNLQSPISNSQSMKVGVSICEDIWVKESPCRQEAALGAQLLVNISASPYHAGKMSQREKVISQMARETGTWVAYTNLVGGQDELVFDGGSLLVDPKGKVVFRAPQLEEGLFVTEIPPRKGKALPPLSPDAEIFQALVVGTRDYCVKNGFSHAVLGLSGGIDSSLVASCAVAALGCERVTGVSMPSRYSSEETKEDAREVARRLGIQFFEFSIEGLFETALITLQDLFRGLPTDVTEQNLQARIRGLILMALSNKFHWLVLATGNKSEISTGYCTLYGDMVGGFAVIKDLPKTWVYRLGRYANRFFERKVIPESVFERPPTAELAPHQRDQDTLPPYEKLDRIVKMYVEEDRSTREVKAQVRLPRQELLRVLRMIDSAEYKRRQAPIGIKITPRAFGKDRRMPITNKYSE